MSLINDCQRKTNLAIICPSLSHTDRVTQASNVKDILFIHDFGHVWINQTVGVTKYFFLEILKVRLRDGAARNCSAGINSMSRFSTYYQFKSSLGLESYNTGNLQKKFKFALG